MKHIHYCFLLLITFTFITSCKKFVDAGLPSTQLVRTTVFASDATATSAQLSIYAAMESDGLPYWLSLYSGLSSDELSNYATAVHNSDLASNNLTTDNSLVLNIWSLLYKYIYQSNSVLEGLAASEKVNAAVKTQLQGEAYFVRAFCHYYLVNFFGDIPLILSTDYRENARAPRMSVNIVHDQIIEDLNKVIAALQDNYVSGTNGPDNERVRPNRFAAMSLLARLYLHKGDWVAAEQQATSVIAQSGLYNLETNLSNVFLKGSTEAIWQLSAVVPGYNSYPGRQFILTGPPAETALTDTLIKSFEQGDQRRLVWVGELLAGQTYYYPYKYKAGYNSTAITEYSVLFRLAEQFLIRSEARTQQNKFSEANQDLNTIRQRAGLSALSFTDKVSLIVAISKERKVELFAENGHRWIDLKRMNMAGAILGGIKFPDWQTEDQLYPIPQTERNKNPNLSQNSGY